MTEFPVVPFEGDLKSCPHLCGAKLGPAFLGGALMQGLVGQMEGGRAGYPSPSYSCPYRRQPLSSLFCWSPLSHPKALKVHNKFAFKKHPQVRTK